ncbi:MAG TPA: c-type cytochrome [Acidobacteriaceae bacterium]|jgi:mono/diheme cytochrome c family protein|nr:c-type cytochrome [Acidobacteriaceae bacterium]
MRHPAPKFAFALGLTLLMISAIGQQTQQAGEDAPKVNAGQDRAAATRTFLGLGTPPDRVAAVRAAPIYQQNCAFCHGTQARGATGPGLITSDLVLKDDHGEHLAPFFKAGRPEKGMPAFGQLTNQQLVDLAEFLHVQVEDVANRGAYEVQDIVVGDPAKGQAYFMANCMTCHTASTFLHIASKFRSPDQLQRDWVWPSRPEDHSLAITATVKTATGAAVSGRVTQISDFSITLISSDGQMHVIERKSGIHVQMNDPLAAHQALVMTLRNDDMHDVTAYLELLK